MKRLHNVGNYYFFIINYSSYLITINLLVFQSNESTAEQQKLICRDGTGTLDGLKSSLVHSSSGTNSDYSINSLFSKVLFSIFCLLPKII